MSARRSVPPQPALPASGLREGDPLAGIGASAALEAPLFAAIDRLIDVIDAEERALAAGDRAALDGIVQRKSRLLLELSRMGRPAIVSAAAHREIAAVRRRLERNGALIAMHLRATREIGTVIAASLAAEEWDGTYAAPARGGAR